MSKESTDRLALIAYAGPALPIAVLEMPLIVYIVPFYAAELGLELAPIVGSDLADPEGELVDDIVDGLYRIGLLVPFVNLYDPHAGRGVLDSVELPPPSDLLRRPSRGNPGGRSRQSQGRFPSSPHKRHCSSSVR